MYALVMARSFPPVALRGAPVESSPAFTPPRQAKVRMFVEANAHVTQVVFRRPCPPRQTRAPAGYGPDLRP